MAWWCAPAPFLWLVGDFEVGEQPVYLDRDLVVGPERVSVRTTGRSLKATLRDTSWIIESRVHLGLGWIPKDKVSTG